MQLHGASNGCCKLRCRSTQLTKSAPLVPPLVMGIACMRLQKCNMQYLRSLGALFHRRPGARQAVCLSADVSLGWRAPWRRGHHLAAGGAEQHHLLRRLQATVGLVEGRHDRDGGSAACCWGRSDEPPCRVTDRCQWRRIRQLLVGSFDDASQAAQQMAWEWPHRLPDLSTL